MLSKVAFDGSEPRDLQGDEREIARQIFGDVDAIPKSARHMLAAMCGGRGGKSYFMGGLRALHLAVTLKVKLAPGEQASAVIVAPDMRLAMQTLRYASGAAQASPEITKMIVGDVTTTHVTIKRPDGVVVRIECLPASRGGSAVRGRVLVCAVLDEACFFRDGSYAVNDEEIYKAVSPRIAAGGQLIVASTPWAESGLLFQFHADNFGKPTTAIAAHAPTLVLRDDEYMREQVERERQRDPENAAREFDAIPMGAGTSAFFDSSALKACIVDGPPVLTPNPSMLAWLGLDTGFRKDPSAAVVGRTDPGNGGVVEVAEVIEVAPQRGERLVPSETIRKLWSHGQAHGCKTAIADQHYIESVREYAPGMRLLEAPCGAVGKVEAHVAARAMVNEGRVRIQASQTKLIQQLREIVSKPTSGGGIAILSPRKGGTHGDIASALVLVLWAAYTRQGIVDVPTISAVGGHAAGQFRRAGRRGPLG